MDIQDIYKRGRPSLHAVDVLKERGKQADNVTHKCEVCSRVFHRKKYLVSHLDTHFDVKKYECVVCKKKFRQMGHLKTHARIHTEEKPFRCPVCLVRFRHSNRRCKEHPDEKLIHEPEDSKSVGGEPSSSGSRTEDDLMLGNFTEKEIEVAMFLVTIKNK